MVAPDMLIFRVPLSLIHFPFIILLYGNVQIPINSDPVYILDMSYFALLFVNLIFKFRIAQILLATAVFL